MNKLPNRNSNKNLYKRLVAKNMHQFSRHVNPHCTLVGGVHRESMGSQTKRLGAAAGSRQVILNFHAAGNKFVGGFFEHLKSIVKKNSEIETGTLRVLNGLHTTLRKASLRLVYRSFVRALLTRVMRAAHF